MGIFLVVVLTTAGIAVVDDGDGVISIFRFFGGYKRRHRGRGKGAGDNDGGQTKQHSSDEGHDSSCGIIVQIPIPVWAPCPSFTPF